MRGYYGCQASDFELYATAFIVLIEINNYLKRKIYLYATAPCAAGTYSTTGYADSGCKPCPVNFYQDEQGMMTCKECELNQITSASGSNTVNNCSNIEEGM